MENMATTTPFSMIYDSFLSKITINSVDIFMDYFDTFTKIITTGWIEVVKLK